MVTQPLIETAAELREAGLERSAYELELYGYTVLPEVLDTAAVARLTDALLALAQDDRDPSMRSSSENSASGTWEVPLLLTRGGVPFEQLVLHPRVLPLVTYLLGRSCTLSSVTGYVKGQGGTELGIHSDTAYVPDPLPALRHEVGSGGVTYPGIA